MAEPSKPLDLVLQDQSVVDDFARNRLPKHHPLFANLSSRHGRQSKGRDTVPQPMTMPASGAGPLVKAGPDPHHPEQLPAPAPGAAGAAGAGGAAPPKAPPNVVGAMKFWNRIFKDAMLKFKATPGLKDPERDRQYDIRKADNWDAIHNKLVAARDQYTKETGIGGRIRQAGRWLADNATGIVSTGLAVSPKPAITTPVFEVVGIIVEAVQTGAETRKEVLKGLEGLDDVFSDVELFLGTFEDEGDIKDKAISLIAHVFLAVERGIGFFTRNGLLKGLKTILQGKKYEEPLRDSLKDITGDSKSLMAQAVKTHIRDFQRYSIQTRTILQLILNGQEDLAVKVVLISGQLDEVTGQLSEVNKNMGNAYSIIMMLGDRYEQTRATLREENMTLRQEKELERAEKERERAEKERERNETQREREARLALERHNARLETQNRMLRSLSPSFQQSAWAPPPPPQHRRQPPPQLPFIDQDTLWRLLDMDDMDVADMDYIEAQGPRLDAADRCLTEQIVLNHLFEDWVVSPRSAKLLVHGDFHHPIMHTSALSLFCTTLARAFRARKRFLCLVWFCGRHLGTGARGGSEYGSDASDDSDEDGDSDSSGDECGDEYQGLEEPYAHGTRTKTIRTMLRSLIAQLLCDHEFGAGANLLPPGGVPALIARANLDQLRAVFAWLVRLLPEDVTLFCLVDGIIFYESEEYEDPMLDVLGDILGLAADQSLKAALKVLVTSPWPTSIVRVGFEGEGDEHMGRDGKDGGETKDDILSLGLITPAHLDPSSERLRRELGGEIDGDDSAKRSAISISTLTVHCEAMD